ncbi:MAG: hypothetical protein ACRBN8_45255 [Nannocystales bacterium]
MVRVYAVAKDCINAPIQLKNVGDSPMLAPEMFHQLTCSHADQMRLTASQASPQDRDVQDVMSALVALADESAIRRPSSFPRTRGISGSGVTVPGKSKGAEKPTDGLAGRTSLPERIGAETRDAGVEASC